ncbi:putative fatty acyl-CoA reductase CG5065 [Macrosteles quadrilineatus]|uniref:putative fatty acyl-CoA reductase CG5065 n=1 Tax=Macrosteles quadrilineatus TaxID=74068 RepID=UPI0023E24662|nr:putative fatty acyl-CoA reductase CG5065 [Macrosteles quadrilineatus]
MTEGILEWYADQTVLVTGGTGFMGKVLLEKLLRACPDIKRIYILCRAKRGFSPTTRVSEITKLPLFDRLRKENPAVLRKLVAVEGDLTAVDLGLRPDLKTQLLREVTVVFNGAASLRLEWGLKAAIESNTLGTLRVLELAEQMSNLQAFVHLSTAFCHCEYDTLEETTYPSPANPHDIIRICQWMDDTTLELITARLLGPHPNCYTYSKRLAESLVSEFGTRIPCAIARPSIVTPAYREPVPGWVDNLNGPVGVMVGAGKGVIRSMLCGEDNRAEVIPVDVAINAVITIAHKRATHKTDLADQVPAFNISCGDVVPMTWGEVLKRGKHYAYEYPFNSGLWYPNGTIRTNRFVHNLIVFFLQILPAYFIDFVMILIRQKRFMVRVQKRISVGMEVLQYFTMRNWHFRVDRTRALTEDMNQRDREIFYLANMTYHIDEYLVNILLGARQYCMKEPLSSLPTARKHLTWLFWLDCLVKAVLGLLAAWFLVGWVSVARSLLDYSATHLQRLPFLKALVPQASP